MKVEPGHVYISVFFFGFFIKKKLKIFNLFLNPIYIETPKSKTRTAKKEQQYLYRFYLLFNHNHVLIPVFGVILPIDTIA